MLKLGPLESSEYQQVAEWEYGPQENADWATYIAEMNQPQWAHFGLYLDSDLVGCLSLEQIDPQTMAYHVVTAPRRIHPNALADVLLQTAGRLFSQKFTALVARIPQDNRAAARLAIRCGMREWGETPEMRFFILTKARFDRR